MRTRLDVESGSGRVLPVSLERPLTMGRRSRWLLGPPRAGIGHPLGRHAKLGKFLLAVETDRHGPVFYGPSRGRLVRDGLNSSRRLTQPGSPSWDTAAPGRRDTPSRSMPCTAPSRVRMVVIGRRPSVFNAAPGAMQLKKTRARRRCYPLVGPQYECRGAPTTASGLNLARGRFHGRNLWR